MTICPDKGPIKPHIPCRTGRHKLKLCAYKVFFNQAVAFIQEVKDGKLYGFLHVIRPCKRDASEDHIQLFASDGL